MVKEPEVGSDVTMKVEAAMKRRSR